MDIGKRIAYFREQKGYSVNKLANLSGVSQSYLRDIELENKNPTVAFLTIVCNALGISLQDYLMSKTQILFLIILYCRKYISLITNNKKPCLNF